MSEFEAFLNEQLGPYHVSVRFGRKAEEDFASFDPATQQKLIVLLIRQGIKNPLLPPDGLGEPLRGELAGFAKIKPKKLNLRIIYRPTRENNRVIMEVLAIGPRERDRVYTLAAGRVAAFKKELRNSW